MRKLNSNQKIVIVLCQRIFGAIIVIMSLLVNGVEFIEANGIKEQSAVCLMFIIFGLFLMSCKKPLSEV